MKEVEKQLRGLKLWPFLALASGLRYVTGPPAHASVPLDHGKRGRRKQLTIFGSFYEVNGLGAVYTEDQGGGDIERMSVNLVEETAAIRAEDKPHSFWAPVSTHKTLRDSLAPLTRHKLIESTGRNIGAGFVPQYAVLYRFLPCGVRKKGTGEFLHHRNTVLDREIPDGERPYAVECPQCLFTFGQAMQSQRDAIDAGRLVDHLKEPEKKVRAR